MVIVRVEDKKKEQHEEELVEKDVRSEVERRKVNKTLRMKGKKAKHATNRGGRK